MCSIFLFKIWIFNIDFSTLISFILGVGIGMVILLLIYALIVVSSIRTKDFVIKTENDDLTTIEVKQMVADTQTAFKDKTLRQDQTRFAYCQQLSKDLAYAIAVRYYPKSKYPFFELSVNELTLLATYVAERVEQVLNHKGIRLIKKLKVSTIVDLTNKKKQIEESKAFQATVSIGTTFSKVKNFLNIINPINWGIKLIVDNIMNIILNQICLVVIGIVCEETYKIYSKKVFKKEVEIDTGTEAFIEEMSESIKDAAKEIDSDMTFENVNTDHRLKTKILRPSKEYKIIGDTFISSEPTKSLIRNEE